MPDAHYIDPRLAALYDITCGWSADRDFYLGLAGQAPQRIADLGCGTGLICNAYAARGHRVTGVDPAAAMLDIARRTPHGGDIEWIEATAESFRSAAHFDLVIMTGHAFQVLQTDDEIAAAFRNVAAHMAPGGRFVFETRNPAIDWSRRWHHDVTMIEAQGMPVRETRRFLSRIGELVQFEQVFAFPDANLVSDSTLRFASRGQIEALLAASGLGAETVLGTWDGAAFSGGEDEMIFVARPALSPLAG